MSRLQRKDLDKAGSGGGFIPLRASPSLPALTRHAVPPLLTSLGMLLCLALAPFIVLAQSGAKPAELVLRSDGTAQGVPGRYALIVAVDDYSQAGLPSLRFSERDAQAIMLFEYQKGYCEEKTSQR